MSQNNELIEHPSWWKRNWKWAVPVGGCLTIIVIGVIIVAVGAYTFANKIKTSAGSDQALISAQANQDLINILGEPIENDGFGNYNISIENGVKSTNATVPIKGPRGTATIHISARGEDEEKVYDVYNVTIDNSNQVIELDPPSQITLDD